MEGFQGKLLSVHRAMGRIQLGEREWKPVPSFPRVHREPFQTVNPVKARASGFLPDLASDSYPYRYLTSDTGAFIERRSGVGVGEDNEFSSTFKTRRPWLAPTSVIRRGAAY